MSDSQRQARPRGRFSIGGLRRPGVTSGATGSEEVPTTGASNQDCTDASGLRAMLEHHDFRDFTDGEVSATARILLELDIDLNYPKNYGGVSPVQDLGSLAVDNPGPMLAGIVGELHTALVSANPERVGKSRGALARWSGKSLEVEVEYRVACNRIDQLVRSARERVEGSKSFLDKLDKAIAGNAGAISSLRCHLAAGRLHLASLPPAPPRDPADAGTASARDRFAARLTNLGLMLQSSALAGEQLRLMRGQIEQQTERLGHSGEVLLTVWRNHAFAVFSQSGAPVELATAYRDALKLLEDERTCRPR